MKYKICKLQDDNGKIWYQIKERGFLGWNWKCEFNYFYRHRIKYPLRFDSELAAKHHINIMEEIERSKRVKVLECVDFGE